jgi:ABC-type polysaccharide/polyol phosphate export permease
MINFVRQAYYSYRGLFSWLPWPSYITTIVLTPAFSIIMFTLVGRFALGPAVARTYILGLVASYIPFVLSGSILQCFVHEKYWATLSIVYASRGNRAAIFFSRQLFHIPNGFAIAISGLFFSWLLLGLDFGHVNWLVLFLAVLVITLSSCTASACLGNLSVIMNDWIMLYRVFSGILLVMTGVIIPLSSFPPLLAAFSRILPLTHGLPAFRSAFESGTLPAVLPSLAGELTVGLGYAIIGLAGYYVSELIAKRQGLSEMAL